MVKFVLQWLSFHWEILDFPLNSKQDVPFHYVVYDYSCADWDGLHDDLRDVPWQDILLVNFVSQFRLELMYICLMVKYKVKLHSSPWFSTACAAAIVHRNHFFCLYQHNRSSESEVMFMQASNCCKKFLEDSKLAYATKTKESITTQKLGSWDFWWIGNSVFNKGKSAIHPLFSGPNVSSSASHKAKLFAKLF